MRTRQRAVSGAYLLRRKRIYLAGVDDLIYQKKTQQVKTKQGNEVSDHANPVLQISTIGWAAFGAKEKELEIERHQCVENGLSIGWTLKIAEQGFGTSSGCLMEQSKLCCCCCFEIDIKVAQR